jgi:ankyrin repeat protein
MGQSNSTPPASAEVFTFAMEGKTEELKQLVAEYYKSRQSNSSSDNEKEHLSALVNTPGDAAGNTALHAAVFGGHLSIAEFLVSSCAANILLKNDMGCSPLWLAAGYNHHRCLTFLLECIQQQFRGETKASSASESGDGNQFDKAAYVEAVVQDSNKSGDTPLIAASSRGNTEVCQMLLEGVSNVLGEEEALVMLRSTNKSGDTALAVAVSKGLECEKELVVLLIKWDAKDAVNRILSSQSLINQRNIKGLTPLLAACERGNVDILRVLVEAGAKFLLDDAGASPLSIAAFCGQEEVAKALLELDERQDDPEHKPMLNLPDAKSGCTPFWHAARTGNEKMAKFLLEKGADKSIPNNEGLTPLEAALKFKKTKIVDLLTNEQ